MNTKYITTASALTVQALIVMVMSGCASGGIDLVRKGAVNIDDQVSCQYAHLNHVVVEQQGEVLEVSGDLHRNFHQNRVIAGHIHVEIITPDGKTLKRVDTGLYRLSRKSYMTRFSTKLPIKVPSGSTVRIIFDRPFEEDDP